MKTNEVLIGIGVLVVVIVAGAGYSLTRRIASAPTTEQLEKYPYQVIDTSGHEEHFWYTFDEANKIRQTLKKIYEEKLDAYIQKKALLEQTLEYITYKNKLDAWEKTHKGKIPAEPRSGKLKNGFFVLLQQKPTRPSVVLLQGSNDGGSGGEGATGNF